MDAQRGDDSIRCSLTAERHTLDDVVAVTVGLCLQLQLCGCQVRRLGVAARLAVVLVIDGAVARVVEELREQALVEGPVGLQLLLVAHQQVVVVLQNLSLGECLRPEAELVDIAHEVAQCQLCGIGQRQAAVQGLRAAVQHGYACCVGTHHAGGHRCAAARECHVVILPGRQHGVREGISGRAVNQRQLAVGIHAHVAGLTVQAHHLGLAQRLGVHP